MTKIKVFSVYTHKIGTTTGQVSNFKSMAMAEAFAEQVKQNKTWKVVHIDSGWIEIHDSVHQAINDMDHLS